MTKSVGLIKNAVKLRSSELFDLFADELVAEVNVRPLIIVGASKADYLLLEMLRAFLMPKLARSKDQDELLEGDSPLATFSARIKMSRRLGLIDETLFFGLERLRRLRNLSAHSVTFDHTESPAREILGDLREKITSRRSYVLTKERFFEPSQLKPIEEIQCLLLTVCVLLEAIREKVKTTTGNRGALTIAAK